MAINTYPAIASPVKSVQRGSAGGAGTVTITAIDITKSFVNVFGTTSSGTTSASFGLSQAASGNVDIPGMALSVTWNFGEWFAPLGATIVNRASGGQVSANNQPSWNLVRGVNAANYNVNAGSTNLVAAVVQGYLANSTSLVVSGACRWEVVEYN